MASIRTMHFMLDVKERKTVTTSCSSFTSRYPRSYRVSNDEISLCITVSTMQSYDGSVSILETMNVLQLLMSTNLVWRRQCSMKN